jgi:hypothetical protein
MTNDKFQSVTIENEYYLVFVFWCLFFGACYLVLVI